MMVTLVKGKDEVKVPHAVDVQGWLDAGWKVKADKKSKQEQKEDKSSVSPGAEEG